MIDSANEQCTDRQSSIKDRGMEPREFLLNNWPVVSVVGHESIYRVEIARMLILKEVRLRAYRPSHCYKA